MFTIIFSSTPTNIFIVAGRPSIIDTSTHGDAFILTDSLTLDYVSTVTHTSAPDTVDDISAITGISMLDSTSDLHLIHVWKFMLMMLLLL